MNLTEEQKIILNECHKNTYVSAAPGSGKSTMLGFICEKILSTSNNHTVMLVTFTNKASASIISKCKQADITRILGGTFHSIAYRELKRCGCQLSICDEGKKRLLIKKIFDCRKDKDKFERIYERISKLKAEWPWPDNNSLLNRYNQELARFNLMDFDDIIAKYITALESNSISPPPITHILVDELQDTSKPQLVMLQLLQEKTNCNMIGVADDDQCHPSGNQILTTNGYVDIKDLNPKTHKVPAYDGHGKLYGLKNPNGYKIQKTSRLYTGLLYRIATVKDSFECTYNHKCYVQWDKIKAKNIYVTYLMRQGTRFRIGQCQLIEKNGSFHLGIRARLEKADAVWILETYKSRTESLKAEAILATRYRIPTITFEETTSSINFKKNVIDSIFDSINLYDMRCDAHDLLEFYDRDIEFPIWSKEEHQKQGARTLFITQACNVLPEIMYVGVYNGTTRLEKTIITSVTTRGVHNERVYSLNVEKFHNYICNKILVSNSIYAWRGARPENVRDFIDYFKCNTLNMGTNFRSAVSIVHSSKNLIEKNKQRIAKTIRPRPDAPKGTVSKLKCDNHFDEMDYLLRRILQNPDKEIAILYRNRTYKNHLEFKLRKLGISYCVNDLLDITDRSAIKVMLCCAKLACGIGDIYDLEMASKALKGIGSTTVHSIAKVIGESPTLTLSELIQGARTKDKPAKYWSSIIALQEYYDKNEGESLDLFIHWAEELFIPSFEYQEDMRDFLVDIGKGYKLSRSNIRELCNELGLDGKEEVQDEDAQVELSTVHGYKGLEREIVFLPWAHVYLEEKPNKEINVEDERRLFYVAATRAKEKLYISYSGKTPLFVKEMKI